MTDTLVTYICMTSTPHLLVIRSPASAFVMKHVTTLDSDKCLHTDDAFNVVHALFDG